MQNKPNLRKCKMNVSSLLTMDYANLCNWTLGQNKPNSNPIQTQSKPILERINVNFCTAGYYKSKQKALKKPPLLKVNSEPFRKGLLRYLIFLSSPTLWSEQQFSFCSAFWLFAVLFLKNATSGSYCCRSLSLLPAWHWICLYKPTWRKSTP